MTVFQEKWDELASLKDELGSRDWFYATSGNLSIKASDSPLTFLISVSGKDKRQRTKDDFLLVDEQGHPTSSTKLYPSAETPLHLAVYKQSNAVCCIHIHTVDNNVISELYGEQGQVSFHGQEMIKALDEWEEDAEITIPIIRNDAYIPLLADSLSTYVTADKGAVLIRNHGITVWGRSVFEAKKILEAYEFLFSYHLKILQLKRDVTILS
ncbi:methylthioribulose 1-phosphate dehydratase [Cytobacillus sp. IB215316]|uniref:methylthioribulose 1-phosphate dehydratase n=1 Tax=Cytobacillus sp. IB215316 TaxID=3097354 RepID=UPI002A151278|nr:methylthioribulose 1-phosphate dehydratase [Cytobacillus sp. IB215316]MDX8362680.1 methylthioribulose 1-phosphate dehydratase [Cytobacillus sp. IB215316]